MDEIIQEQEQQNAPVKDALKTGTANSGITAAPATNAVPVKRAKSMQKRPQKMKPDFKKADPYTNYKRFGRELAMQFLYQCDMRASILEPGAIESFREQAEESGLFGDEKTFLKAMTYAEQLIGIILADRIEIDRIIERYSKSWDLERLSAVDRNIMRTAIAEMRSCDAVPLLVSINEAIEISKDFSDKESKRFINGILNSVKVELESQKKTQ